MKKKARLIFKKVIDFLKAKGEIAIEKSNRQTVLSAESSTVKFFLSAFRVLHTRSLEVAQLFPSAYFTLSQTVTTVLGFLFLTRSKYIGLRHLCQVKT
jgi:hypothetical protein